MSFPEFLQHIIENIENEIRKFQNRRFSCQ